MVYRPNNFSHCTRLDAAYIFYPYPIYNGIIALKPMFKVETDMHTDETDLC